jgi:hypothetical protein
MYEGDLTYYGGAGAGGACSQKYVPPGYLTVALNHDQFGEGHSCGTCLRACVTKPSGVECFKAIVDNECPECTHGDLDLGISGDGRWQVSWSTIKCPPAAPMFDVQGSNAWYLKLKIEGQGPLQSVRVNTREAKHTLDDFWVIQDPNGGLGCPPTITFTRADGSVGRGCMSQETLKKYGASESKCINGAMACTANNVPTQKPNAPRFAGKHCENGLLSSNGKACCPKSCNRCGGKNCHKLHGGHKQCCSSYVLKHAKQDCEKSKAPCTIYR